MEIEKGRFINGFVNEQSNVSNYETLRREVSAFFGTLFCYGKLFHMNFKVVIPDPEKINTSW